VLLVLDRANLASVTLTLVLFFVVVVQSFHFSLLFFLGGVGEGKLQSFK